MSFINKFVFWTLIVPIVASVVSYYALVWYERHRDSLLPAVETDGWWAVSDRAKTPISTDIKQFIINVSNAELEDLKLRLQRARFTPNIVSDHTYGFRGDQLKEIRNYWAEKYDWRKWEREINNMKHYITQIEGINVHYAIVKPPSEAEAGGSASASASSSGETITLVLLHGWPSSFFEFKKLSQLLIKPDGQAYAGSNLRFELIIPSLPGYGWSEAPHRPGMNLVATARVLLKLLARLGKRAYYIHGGDWGALVSQTMARLVADKLFVPEYAGNSQPNIIVKGVHTNLPLVPATKMTYWIKLVVAWLFPAFVLQPGEYAQIFPFEKQVINLWNGTGYLHIQATRPDTVSAALTDSPVGLAAYILEKYSAWTHRENPQRADGGLTEKYSLDELLTNVMVYWLSESIGSSVRLYKESFSLTAPDVFEWFSQPLRGIPVGVAAFPHEIFVSAKWFVQDVYPVLVHYTQMSKGGHFPALEEPELLSRSIRETVHAAELYWSSQ